MNTRRRAVAGFTIAAFLLSAFSPVFAFASTLPSALTTTSQSSAIDFEILNKFAEILRGLQEYLTHQIPAEVPQSVAAGGSSSYVGAGKIDNLANTTIQSPTITGGSISGASISGSVGGTFTGVGLFSAATTSALAISSIPWGLLATDGAGNIVATSTPTALNFVATSATATSTFAGGLAVGSKFLVQQGSGNVGIGTALPYFYGKLQVSVAANQNFVFRSGGNVPTARIEAVNDAINTNVPMEFVASNFSFAVGNVGIGTTTPSTKLQVAGAITPDGDNAYTLGNSTYRWSALYSANGTIQTSDQRLKSNITDLSYGLSDILKLRPVSYTWTAHPEQGVKLGFIAQEAQSVLPEVVVVGDDANHTLGINYSEIIPAIVKSLQQLNAKLAETSATVAGYAERFTTKELTFERATGKKLCLQKSDGTPVCVTGDQLAVVLASAGQCPAGSGANNPIDASSTATAMPPVIGINGSDPASIHVGESYADLGATITAPDADKNLDIHTFLNGAVVSNIVIDTSAEATDTIDYVVSDAIGQTATATRTVIVEAPSFAN